MIKKVIVLIIVFVSGSLIGYYSMPQKVTIKTEVIEKTVEVKKENIDKDTVILKVTKKDGTVIEKTTIKDKVKTESRTESEKIAKSETIKENASKWKAMLLYNGVRDGKILASDPRNFGVGVEHRVIGPLSVQVQGTLRKDITVGVGLNF